MTLYNHDKNGTWGNNEMVCPYCGENTGSERDSHWDLNDGDCFKEECDACGKEFEVSAEVETVYKYTTECLEGAHEGITEGEYKEVIGKPHRYIGCKNCQKLDWFTNEDADKMFASIELEKHEDIIKDNLSSCCGAEIINGRCNDCKENV